MKTARGLKYVPIDYSHSDGPEPGGFTYARVACCGICTTVLPGLVTGEHIFPVRLTPSRTNW